MKRLVWPSISLCAALPLLMSLGAGQAHAAPDEEVAQDPLALKISGAIRPGRVFGRAGVIYVKIKTKSGQTYDVTGNVVSTEELINAFQKNASNYPNVDLRWPSDPSFTREQVRDFLFGRDPTDPTNFGYLQDPEFGVPLLTNYLRENGISGIGTPPGITGVAKPQAGTAGFSLGYYLDDDYKWAVETYVLAAPISTSVSVRGNYQRFTKSGYVTTPIGINGADILKTKLLPPVVMVGRYFGDKDAAFRPYLGAIGMYAIFYDTKATQTLNNYVGGQNPGDTTVKIKNAFGLGPMLGMKYQFNDTWHASLNVGHVKLKTQATLTTRNTMFDSQSQIIQELGPITEKINTGESVYGNPANAGCADVDVCEIARRNGGLVGLLMKGVAADRGRDNLGTYVRKTDTTLTNTIFFLSVGRSF